MQGAILCKYQGNIVMLSYGEYEQQAGLMDICKQVVRHDEIKLVKCESSNVASILKSQASINEKFKKEFS